jgi:threonine dehydratase
VPVAEVPPLPISIADVREAAGRLNGVANRTPVMTSRTFDELVGGARVFFKCENFQLGGAFKFRGAYNHISALTREERANGVVAASSGNHAQGVALAARLLGIPALIVMPFDAPSAKLAATRGYGAEVVQYDRLRDRPEVLLAQFAAERGMHPVPAFDDAMIMAGQGTAALELLEEVGPLDLVVVPTGGGGLLSGTVTAARGLSPATRVFGIEPEGADDWVQSLARGERVAIDPPTTIADGVRTRQPGILPFAVVSRLVDGIATVSDNQIREAVRFHVLRMKLLVEPTGAIPAAALMSGKLGDLRGLRIGAIISGGNVDPEVLCAILRG